MLILAAPAASEVWSGWVGIAQKTGFGLVSPLPGIWPSLHLDTAITLPVGVEAYAAYALRAWLARDQPISARTRRFAKWSAISSFALGMAGQVAYHLMAQAGMTRAPWAVTTIVSCLPVLVLGMGTALAHMLRADAEATDAPDSRTGPPAVLRSRSPEDQDGPDRGRPRAGPARPTGGVADTGAAVHRHLRRLGHPVTLRELGLFAGDASGEPNTGYLVAYASPPPLPVPARTSVRRTLEVTLDPAGSRRGDGTGPAPLSHPFAVLRVQRLDGVGTQTAARLAAQQVTRSSPRV